MTSTPPLALAHPGARDAAARWPSTTAPPSGEAPVRRLRTAAWIVGGAAVVAAGAGLALQLAARSKRPIRRLVRDTPDDHGGSTGTLSRPRMPGSYDTWESYRRWSIVGYVSGAALAVTSGVLFLTSRPPSIRRRPRHAAHSSVRADAQRDLMPGRLLMTARGARPARRPRRAATARPRQARIGGRATVACSGPGGTGGQPGGPAAAGLGGTGGPAAAAAAPADSRPAARAGVREAGRRRSGGTGGSNPVFVGGPCVSLDRLAGVEVFARASDGRIYRRAYDGSNWGNWGAICRRSTARMIDARSDLDCSATGTSVHLVATGLNPIGAFLHAFGIGTTYNPFFRELPSPTTLQARPIVVGKRRRYFLGAIAIGATFPSLFEIGDTPSPIELTPITTQIGSFRSGPDIAHRSSRSA